MIRRLFTASLALLMILLLCMPIKAHAAVSNWQQGASISPLTQTDFSTDAYRQSLTNLAATGANYVTLIVSYYQTSINTTDIQAGYNTPTDASLIDGINYAHSLGMHVMLKVHIETFDHYWRAYIDPADRASWFNNYGAELVHLGQIGQQTGVEQICLGVELYHMTSPVYNPSNDGYWRTMIANVRAVYPGLLNYDAQRPHAAYSETADIKFWPLLDSIGLSAYWTLGSKPTDTVDNLRAAWNQINISYVAPLYQKYHKPIIFTELGYRSYTGSHLLPWDYTTQGPVNQGEQARDYEALFSYWDKYPYMQGVHLWNWSVNPNDGGSTDTGFSPQNKLAQNTISKWFGGTVFLPNMSAVATPNPVAVGQTTTITATGGSRIAESDVLVDVEIYDSLGRQVSQYFYEHQNFGAGTKFSVQIPWVPAATGNYRVAMGVFTANWGSQIRWQNNVRTITVQ